MRKLLFILLPVVLLAACIKKAPLNPEADIEFFMVADSLLTGTTTIDQANRKIKLFLSNDAYEQGITPEIRLSANATISPASGVTIHPRQGAVIYKVTSQNGVNSKEYTVEVVNVGSWVFNFENWQQNEADKYEYPVEPDGVSIWSSGNPGVALSGVPKRVDAYPTRSTSDGLSGTKAAEMVTIEGTPLSAIMGIYLYAGSLFTGNFNTSVVLTNPLAATEFGEPYVGHPVRFAGYYKYTPGAVYQDASKNPVPGKTDECSIYAVLYQGPERLNGSNINTSDRVVAIARLEDGSAKAAFTRFDIPFQYRPGKESVTTNLMLAIVASSSVDGDLYRGAIGSRLVVDSLRIIAQ